MSEHIDPIMGTNISDTVSWIISKAVRANTAEGYRAAAEQIHGIDMLILTMQEKMRGFDRKASWGTFYNIALMNEMRRMEELAETPALRELMERVKVDENL